MTAACNHDEQEVLSVRFESEVYKRQPDGSLKADPYFDSSDVELASKCLQCGKVIQVTNVDTIKDIVEKAMEKFFA